MLISQLPTDKSPNTGEFPELSIRVILSWNPLQNAPLTRALTFACIVFKEEILQEPVTQPPGAWAVVSCESGLPDGPEQR